MDTGCTVNEERYSEPMVWIGMYITAASIACFLAMIGDVISGFRHRKFWFPCRFFSVNATSLTLISIATKLPVDLNTPMLPVWDQLTKLSGTVLICTTMANFMPSLGTMEDSQVILNVVPLGILVITIIINVCIQMVTGVIFLFLLEHIMILFFMLIMLLIFCSSALAVSTTKQLLRQQYELKYQQATDDDKVETSTLIKLRNDVRKCWMMAHCCSPQHVLSRSTMCTASGAFCLLAALVLTWAFISLCWLQYYCSNIPPHQSDYNWSIVFVYFCQFSAVWVGTIAPVWRWFNVVNSRGLEIKSWSEFKGEFKVERYWIQRLLEWKDRPLPFDIGNRRCQKIVHGSRNRVLNVCLCMQIVIVLSSKSIRLVSIAAVKTLFCFPCIIPLRLFKAHRSVSNEEMRSSSGSEIDQRDFVLHLEGEEKLIQLIMKQGYVDPEKWIQRGRKNRLIHLMNLLKKCTISQGFLGVGEFDSDRVSPVGSEEPPPNIWALPLVTLTSIAIAIPRIRQDLIESVLLGVNEGLRYVRLVDKKLDLKGPVYMNEAADIIWLGVDLYHRWLDVDLAALGHEEKDPKKIIERLAEIGKNCVLEFENSMGTVGGNQKSSLKWPAKALAGNSLYRLCQTILEDYENKFGTVEELLEWLCVTISDILGACLTNLPHVISKECFSSAIEAKEDRIRKAASLLGEVENILDTLGHQGIEDLGIDQCAYIDDWRASKLKDKNPSRVPSATSNGDTSRATSGELRLSIE